MEFRALSQCKSDLNFRPEHPVPEVLPILSVQGQRLMGFELQNAEGRALEIQAPIEDLFSAVYPKLSFVELSRLFHLLIETKTIFDKQRFFENWGYSLNENLLQATKLALALPDEFQSFAAQNELSPRDLEPLNLKQSMDEELFRISTLGCSRSEAAILIELISDLKMLKKCPSNIDWTAKASDLIEKLRICRFPKRYGFQKEARIRTKRLSWPKNAKWKWSTRTDQNILDVQLSLKSINDLQTVSEHLQQIADQAQNDGGNPWQ